jgi:hypothetical protein
MAKTVYATFLGGADDAGEEPKSFLDVVQGLELDGPPDLSPRLHRSLYGDDGDGR